jgi:hypothetical protein
VLQALPDLDEDAARALSLIEIAGRTRDQAGDETGIAQDALATALYRARKALRRSIFPLSASGWCERAERLLSDRIDGVLVPPGPARLDVHLRNCERCVDHERRLSQARERLVRDFIDAHPESEGAGPAERSVAATLRVVEPAAVAEAEPEPEYDGPTRTIPSFGGATREPVADDATELPEPSFAGPGGQAEIRVEVPRREAVADAPADPDPVLEADPSIEQEIAPAEPADATPSEDDAEQAEPPVEEAAVAEPVPAASVIAAQTTLEPASVVWGALTLLSVSLATIALVIVILALSGIDRIL